MARRVHQHRIAISLTPGHLAGGNGAARARLVLNQDRLAQAFGHDVAHSAGNQVGATACRERHDKFDGLGGVAWAGRRRTCRAGDLRHCAACAQQREGGNDHPGCAHCANSRLSKNQTFYRISRLIES